MCPPPAERASRSPEDSAAASPRLAGIAFGIPGSGLHGRQILDPGEPKRPQKPPGGDVHVGPAEVLGPPANRDKIAFQQMPEHLLATNPTDRLDLGPGDRLPIGHDRQRFKGRRGQTARGRLVEEPANPGSEWTTGEQLVSAGNVLDAKRRAGGVVKPTQFPEQCPRPRAIWQPCKLRQSAGRQGLAGQEHGCFETGQFVSPHVLAERRVLVDRLVGPVAQKPPPSA